MRGKQHELDMCSGTLANKILIFALPLIPCALYQLRKGFEDPYFQKFLLKRNGKPRMSMQKRFQMYVWVSSVGTVVLLIVYLLAGMLP